jgi:hypothetical protein
VAGCICRPAGGKGACRTVEVRLETTHGGVMGGGLERISLAGTVDVTVPWPDHRRIFSGIRRHRLGVVMVFGSSFKIDTDPASVQRIVPASPAERFEGIDFSSCGSVLATATSETNLVLLFRRKADGRFEDRPFRIIGRRSGALDYPHDISFSKFEDSELMAVAQRAGSIAVYKRYRVGQDYGFEPVFEITGPQSKLALSDAVAFVPPGNDTIAACNLVRATISFFRRVSSAPLRFETVPDFELTHPSLVHPDGLAFSRCGRWLAIANHAGQSVVIFRRRWPSSGRAPSYGPEPVAVIADPNFRYPHSVAFTARNSLVVTNAGANFFAVYQPRRRTFGMQWSQTPVVRVIAHDDATFQDVNTTNKMEGGPKGVAIHQNSLAVCSPQIGIKIYSFREGW